jgi:hypothetical protein
VRDGLSRVVTGQGCTPRTINKHGGHLDHLLHTAVPTDYPFHLCDAGHGRRIFVEYHKAARGVTSTP